MKKSYNYFLRNSTAMCVVKLTHKTDVSNVISFYPHDTRQSKYVDSVYELLKPDFDITLSFDVISIEKKEAEKPFLLLCELFEDGKLNAYLTSNAVSYLTQIVYRKEDGITFEHLLHNISLKTNGCFGFGMLSGAPLLIMSI